MSAAHNPFMHDLLPVRGNAARAVQGGGLA